MIPLTNYDMLCQLNPQIPEKTRVLMLSQKIPLAAACYFSDNFTARDVQPFVEAALKQHLEPHGQQILMIFKVEGWRPITLQPYLDLEKELLK